MDIYIFVFCVCWRTYLSCPSPLLPERLLLITPHHHTCQHITLLTMAKGSWKRSCPPVVISDCNQNLSTPWISESKNGLASEDPLSQSTVCNGIQGDYHYGVTSEKSSGTCLFILPNTAGGISQNIPFSSRNQARPPVGPYQDSNETVLGMYGDKELNSRRRQAATAAMPPLLQRPRQAAQMPPPCHSV